MEYSFEDKTIGEDVNGLNFFQTDFLHWTIQTGNFSRGEIGWLFQRADALGNYENCTKKYQIDMNNFFDASQHQSALVII